MIYEWSRISLAISSLQRKAKLERELLVDWPFYFTVGEKNFRNPEAN